MVVINKAGVSPPKHFIEVSLPVLLPDSSAQAALQAQDEARQPKAQNADLKRPVRIVVTQPRRIAAITVAKRVAEELGEKVR